MKVGRVFFSQRSWRRKRRDPLVDLIAFIRKERIAGCRLTFTSGQCSKRGQTTIQLDLTDLNDLQDHKYQDLTRALDRFVGYPPCIADMPQNITVAIYEMTNYVTNRAPLFINQTRFFLYSKPNTPLSAKSATYYKTQKLIFRKIKKYLFRVYRKKRRGNIVRFLIDYSMELIPQAYMLHQSFHIHYILWYCN